MNMFPNLPTWLSICSLAVTGVFSCTYWHLATLNPTVPYDGVEQLTAYAAMAALLAAMSWARPQLSQLDWATWRWITSMQTMSSSRSELGTI